VSEQLHCCTRTVCCYRVFTHTLRVTCIVPTTRVGLRVDKVKCNNFYKTELFVCMNNLIVLIPLLSLLLSLLKAIGLVYLCYRVDCLTLSDETGNFSRYVDNLLPIYVAKHHRISKISSQTIYFYWLDSAALFRLITLQKPFRFNKAF
jgi:hypothetical protein